MLLFQWVTPVIRRGRARPLQPEDLPALPPEVDPRAVPPAFAALRLDTPGRFLRDVIAAVGKGAWAMVALLLAYLFHEPTRHTLAIAAQWKKDYGFAFSFFAMAVAAGLAAGSLRCTKPCSASG